MGRRGRILDPSEMEPLDGVQQVLEAERICWFPVRHYSPACAWHVREVIRALQPDAVLVEGPDDATQWIDALVDPGTEPPVSVLSTWVDRRNAHGMNGVLSPSADVPVRFRAWYPLVPYSPEYVALVEGRRVGAELAFIDAPLPATLPFHHVRNGRVSEVVSDRRLAESAYFEALRTRQRRRHFDELWEANFEVRGLHSDTLDFMRAVLLLAWCTRHVANQQSLEEDGTSLREGHMAWHVREARKRHDGWIVVVTGAFHSVALPWAKPARAKAKADRDTTTLLCAHSYPALARLYDQNRQPGYGGAVWDAVLEGEPAPFEAAASRLLVDVMRLARQDGQPVSTADAVGAWAVAKNLADLRDNGHPTRQDVLDAMQMAYVKGEAGTASFALEPYARRVMVGRRVGHVSDRAGKAPLLGAYYEAAKQHRIDVSGEHKIVRCDLGKQVKHRQKSAFLHQCDFLGIPMFAGLDKGDSWRNDDAHFKGPDPVTGENMHLIAETWGIRWSEEVDDRLIELADRGSTLEEVATTGIREAVEAARGDAAETTALLLRTARMMLLDLFEPVLHAVEDALTEDRRFLSLTRALLDFQLLYELREGLATHGVDRLLGTIGATYTAAVLQIPANPEDEQLREHVERLQDLVRLALTFEPHPLDEQMLCEQLERVLRADEVHPGFRGAVLGVLYGFGHRRESDIAAELERMLAGSGARDAGLFLEGLFTAGKSVMLGGRRLLAAVDDVLGQLDWPTFRAILPDLRRAFTQFIPSELDAIGVRVAARIGLSSPADPDQPVPDGLRALVAETDRRVSGVLAGWTSAPTR
ncbi:MAG: hypothetical protein H6737_30200 [Alphaproteobacteria bacterium]|nr:hypothetical protein [Alphaproteobacteria bacterium]